MAIAAAIDIKNNIAQRSTQRLNFNPVAQAATSYTTDSNKTVETSLKRSGLTAYSFGQMPVYANAPGDGSMVGDGRLIKRPVTTYYRGQGRQ